MSIVRKLFLFTFFLLSVQALPQSVNDFGGNDIAQLDEEEDDEKKKKKKSKDKDKDESIQLNERFFISFGMNIVAVLILIGFIYYPNYQKREILFTFVIFNVVIFVLTFALNHIKMSMGAAFGLFAVFSMLRYRTEGISPKDMTYLFIVIAVGLIGAIQLDYIVLMIIYLIVVAFTFLLDGNILFKRQFSKLVLYENIELIKPTRNEELLMDLKTRTGLNIYKVSIVKIDFLRDAAQLEIHYYA
jgi:hypothetical protein